MLQQLRRNVQEHSRPDGGLAIGLAIARVWTKRSLSDEWGLTETLETQLLRTWGREPIPSLLRHIGDRGILQISVVDNGPGIPSTLSEAHEALVAKTEWDLFQSSKRLHYTNKAFDERFEGPASWTDVKARLIAFAMDELGTSKTDRPPEVKGLEYLRLDAVIKMGGELIIESDKASVGFITSDQCYGQPRQVILNWCQKGGTGVCFAVPMNPVVGSDDVRKTAPFAARFGANLENGSKADRIIVKDLLRIQNSSGKANEPTHSNCEVFAKEILKMIQLPEYEADIPKLREMGLLIIDWGEMPDSKNAKNVFHFIFVTIAKGLSQIEAGRMRPFIFANLPLGLCGLLGKAVKMYSHLDNPTPICAFVAEQNEPFWLGLDSDNLIPEKLRNQVLFGLRRKITDRKENCTEAFLRDCFANLLVNAKAVRPADNAVLVNIRVSSRGEIKQSPAFSRLNILFSRCSLLREQTRSVDGQLVPTGSYEPVFCFQEIADAVHDLFLNVFHETFTRPPICFIPGGRNGVRLPHSNKVVARYFRSDALVDCSIATELVQELASIALGIATKLPGGRIDWVVSCTSPLHWFVHRIVDSLSECGMNCSHHIFSSYEAIPYSLEDIDMRPGEIVLVFTDVISSGQTASRMADSLVNRFGVKMAGLIALADTRTIEDRKQNSKLDDHFGDAIICLYNEPEPHRADLFPNYYVHPETVVPKRVTTSSPIKEFFEHNFSGTGTLIENHAYFSSAKRTLDVMKSLGAVHFGHFQHGSHHSEVFVDVEAIFACRDYRNLIVTALFQYIIKNDIRLVLYPSHSSAYMLVDDLKQRFMPDELNVKFIIACRTFRGARGTSYALTPFSPNSDPEWPKYSGSGVLILDDAVCSGATAESIMAELARVDRNYYDRGSATLTHAHEPNFSVHVVAFLNRLPRVTGDFWGGLSMVTADRVQFSTFVNMPLAADSSELCSQCRLEKKLGHARDSVRYCLYAKEFLSWWISRNVMMSSHERRHTNKLRIERFSSEESLRLTGYISAIERNGYNTISEMLFDRDGMPAEEKSKAVRIHVRSRAGFLHGLLSKSGDPVAVLCKEIESLIDLALSENGAINPQEYVLEILQFLTLRYFREQPTQNETEEVIERLLIKLAPSFENRLVVGGIASVLDSCLKWYAPPVSTEREFAEYRDRLRARVCKVSRTGLPQKANLMLDWFDAYLAGGVKGINSVGDAVKLLAEFAKKGRRNHFYGRHELDELRDIFEQPASKAAADGADDAVRRVFVCTDRFIELVNATRVLQSASVMDSGKLKYLQDETENDAKELKRLCLKLLKCQNADEVLNDKATVKALFLRSYERWFPKEQRSSAAMVISHFTPNIHDSLISAWENFIPVHRSKQVINMKMTDLLKHKSMKVLVDPSVLITAMCQFLDNIDRIAEPNSSVSVLCEIRLPGELSKDVNAQPNINSGQVEVVVSNSGTSPPGSDQIKLRGLAAVKMRLLEYGGGLDYVIPKSDWSFQVMMKLLVWTEEEK
jgi:hypothetical protein